MDIVAEIFGDKCIRPISINTTVARPIVYRSIRDILILKYWARKAKHHNISLIVGIFRVTHIMHHTFELTS